MNKKMWRIKATVEQWRMGWLSICDDWTNRDTPWTKGDIAAMLSVAVWKAFSPGCNPVEAYPVIAGHSTQVRPD